MVTKDQNNKITYCKITLLDAEALLSINTDKIGYGRSVNILSRFGSLDVGR